MTSHYACQPLVETQKRETQVQATLRGARYYRRRALLLCSCTVPSCLKYHRLCPGVAASTSERTWMNLEGWFGRVFILIDMLSGDDFFFFAALPICPEWLRTCLFPTPFMCAQKRWFSICGPGPPSGRPTVSQVGAPSAPPPFFFLKEGRGEFNCIISLT